MPELAEVEHARRLWDAAVGATVTAVRSASPRARPLRDVDLDALTAALVGQKLAGSEARGKQMAFRFGAEGDRWLGLHLGMSGRLRVEPAGHEPARHEHVVIDTDAKALVFHDPRGFGRVRFARGEDEPAWWSSIAPSVLSDAFSLEAVRDFLTRRAKAPVKAVLLMQERFPGIGNWMADEILWRAALHPKRLAGSLKPAEIRALWRECRHVARLALDTIAGKGDYLPPDLNAHIPKTWLFLHRWEDGGRCPKTKKLLHREEVGGRTTCWSPARQKLRPA